MLTTLAAVLGNSLTTTGFDGFNEDRPLSLLLLFQLGLMLVGGGLFARDVGDLAALSRFATARLRRAGLRHRGGFSIPTGLR